MGTGVSTEVSLPSGSSVERRVGSNPVIRTNKIGTALVVVPFLFIKVAGFEGSKVESHSRNVLSFVDFVRHPPWLSTCNLL